MNSRTGNRHAPRSTGARSRLRLLTVMLTLLAPVACDREEAAEEAEHPSVVVTQWNDSTELFLEYPHLLAGEATGNWAIHLTSMKDFRAITSGVLIIRFLRDGAVAETFTLEAPARAGIYLLDPVIEDAGVYEVELALASPQVTSAHRLEGVRVFDERSELPETAEEPAGGISFLKEQQWQIPFAVEPAQERAVARSVGAPGEIVAPDGAMVLVSAPVSGIAEATVNRTAPSVGESVGAGDLLAVLSPLAGEEGYARLRGRVEELRREAERAERLHTAGAIPRRRLEEAVYALEVAQAELSAIGGATDGDYQLRVRAPISGVVAERSFVPGGRVQAGEPLFTIVDPRTLWLRLHMPPAAAAGIPSDAVASFTVEGTPRVFTTSRLVAAGNVVDSRTRTVPVVYAVENAGGMLRVGQFARGTVPIGGTAMGVAIPSGAVLDENGTPVAYVQVGGETFERRVLTLGEQDGVLTQVVSGIAPGEMVVTIGAYQVRLASLSPEGFSGGHAH